MDLTGVDVSTPEARRALVAQLVWTLSPTSPRIAITVDGEPLDPAQSVYTINTVTSFDPDRLAGTGQVASDPFYVRSDGAIVGLLDGAAGAGSARRRSRAGQDALPSRPRRARSRRSPPTPPVARNCVMALPQESDKADPLLKADSLTAPSFTRAGDEAWVVQNGGSKPEVYRVSSSGSPSRERVGSTQLTGKGSVTALALSPDGVRVAIVAGERLYLGVLTRTAVGEAGPRSGDPAADAAAQTPLAISQLTVLRPDLVHVGPVSFSNSRELLVAASTSPNTYRSLWDVSIDGFESRKITDRGIFGDIDGLAVAAGEPLLITFGGRVWQLVGSQTDGQWQSPLQNEPFLNGSSPFYPS